MVILLLQLIDIYALLILVAVVMSWLQLSPANPIAQFVTALTEPLLGPARRMIPPMGGLDISPMIVLIALQILRSIIAQST